MKVKVLGYPEDVDGSYLVLTSTGKKLVRRDVHFNEKTAATGTMKKDGDEAEYLSKYYSEESLLDQADSDGEDNTDVEDDEVSVTSSVGDQEIDANMDDDDEDEEDSQLVSMGAKEQPIGVVTRSMEKNLLAVEVNNINSDYDSSSALLPPLPCNVKEAIIPRILITRNGKLPYDWRWMK